MRFYEFTNEAIDRRDFLKGLAGAAATAAVPGIARAGEYVDYDDLVKDTDTLEKVWVPRMNQLQERANKMLAKLIGAAGPQWASQLKGSKVNVESNQAYAQSNAEDREISIDLTVFWDADDAVLAFVIAHELGHIALGHNENYSDIKAGADPMAQEKRARSFRQEELDADNFAVRLARTLGYSKANVFKFMHKKESDYAYMEVLTSSPSSTHPSFKQRIQKAKLNGFQLSRGGIQQMNALKTHLA